MQLLFHFTNPMLKSNVRVWRGFLFRQLKTVKHSEAAYNETKPEPNTFKHIIPSFKLEPIFPTSKEKKKVKAIVSLLCNNENTLQ